MVAQLFKKRPSCVEAQGSLLRSQEPPLTPADAVITYLRKALKATSSFRKGSLTSRLPDEDFVCIFYLPMSALSRPRGLITGMSSEEDIVRFGGLCSSLHCPTVSFLFDLVILLSSLF